MLTGWPWIHFSISGPPHGLSFCEFDLRMRYFVIRFVSLSTYLLPITLFLYTIFLWVPTYLTLLLLVPITSFSGYLSLAFSISSFSGYLPISLLLFYLSLDTYLSFSILSFSLFSLLSKIEILSLFYLYSFNMPLTLSPSNYPLSISLSLFLLVCVSLSIPVMYLYFSPALNYSFSHVFIILCVFSRFYTTKFFKWTIPGLFLMYFRSFTKK